jgi:hypothetical protein
MLNNFTEKKLRRHAAIKWLGDYLGANPGQSCFADL